MFLLCKIFIVLNLHVDEKVWFWTEEMLKTCQVAQMCLNSFGQMQNCCC